MAGSITTTRDAAGITLFKGTAAQFDGLALPSFVAGDTIDVTDLLAATGKPGVLGGTTARFDGTTGTLTVANPTAATTIRLSTALKPGNQVFTVRTDGAGGTLVKLTAATGQEASIGIGATALRASGGPDGTGIIVGVISVSGNTKGGLAQDVVNRELPQDTDIVSDAPAPQSDEGREMAQLVHSIAPGAAIRIAYAYGATDGQDVADAITKLVAAKAKVIVDDVSVFGDRMYQEGGPIARAMADAAAQGVVFVTSAANVGANFYESPLALQRTTLPGVPGLVYAYDFGRGTNDFFEPMKFTSNHSGNVDVTLGWTQPGENPAYTLTLAIFTRNPDGSYTRTGDAPLEPTKDNKATANISIKGSVDGGTFFVAVYATAPVQQPGQTFKLIVHHEGNTPVFRDPNTIADRPDPNAGIGSGAIYGHALDANEITAGAVGVSALSAVPPRNETFSAPGPTPGTALHLLEADGTPGTVPVSKPDVSGIDGVYDDVGGIVFSGTSAAAPTVAAVAALMLQVNGNLTRAQIKDMLAASATPTASPTQGGAGLVRAAAAVALASLTAGGTATIDETGKTIAVSAGSTLTTAPGGNTINVSDTATIVSKGPDRINGGTGATTVSTLGSGATIVGGAGALGVTGGPGSNTVYAGTGGLTYNGSTGTDSVIGLGRAMTVTGGTGGGAFYGGGNATITAGAGGDLNVVIGGNGDRLFAAGPKGVLFGASGGDVLMSSAASTGTNVFFGASGTGRMTFVTGAGTDLMALGQGTNDVTLGAGHAVIFANGGHTAVSTITAGSGALDLAFSGASTVLNIAAGAARSFNLYSYGQGNESIHLQGYGAAEAANAIATQRSLGAGTQLGLSDGSVISLVGTARATASLFS